MTEWVTLHALYACGSRGTPQRTHFGWIDDPTSSALTALLKLQTRQIHEASFVVGFSNWTLFRTSPPIVVLALDWAPSMPREPREGGTSPMKTVIFGEEFRKPA
jgi:hypothetical protein